jgi:hypothetical protein
LAVFYAKLKSGAGLKFSAKKIGAPPTDQCGATTITLACGAEIDEATLNRWRVTPETVPAKNAQ